MTIFLVVVVILMVLFFHLNTRDRLSKIEELLFENRRELDSLKKIINEQKPSSPSTAQESPKSKEVEKPVVIQQEVKTVIPAEPVKVEPAQPAVAPDEKTPAEPLVPEVKAAPFYQPMQVVREPRSTFWERNPDLEKFIGENLINKIGIAILVLGIGFFVKYAIDRNWINEIGRVGIGVLCGGILIGVAHKLRKNFSAFSSVLIGGGLSVLYFTIAIAFHDYHIFSQTISFCLMVVVTAFAVLLSIAYDRKELAILSIIGGFSTPFMLSTGEGNYQVLFSYIVILNIGMLVLAYFKKWNAVNIICYVFTLALFLGWMNKAVIGVEHAPTKGAFAFATIFYVIFFLMNIIHNVKVGARFIWLEVSVLLSNTLFYYCVGMSLAEGTPYQGLFTALMAVFNMAFAYSLFRNGRVDKNIVYLMIGLVLTFVSLIAPVQLEGNYITLFWAAEMVLLYWFYLKVNIKLVQIISLVVGGLMLVSLLMDWSQIYASSQKEMTIAFNAGTMTTLYVLVSLFGLSRLLRKDENLTSKFELGVVMVNVRMVVQVLMVAILYFGCFRELSFQLNHRIAISEARVLFIGIYNFVFLAALCGYSKKTNHPKLREVTTGLWVLFLMSYLFVYNPKTIVLRDMYISDQISAFYFTWHYVMMVLSILGLVYLKQELFQTDYVKSIVGKIFNWLIAFVVVFMVSMEADHLIVLFTCVLPQEIPVVIKQSAKIAYPILWGLLSFIFMYLGMTKKVKSLRIISLSLFGVTLLKLAIIDLRGISEGGKIAAFISLGVILLVISFMYQKLKNIILADDQPKNLPVDEK